jgi:uncharacterized small protein (DUF1192 family)
MSSIEEEIAALKAEIEDLKGDIKLLKSEEEDDATPPEKKRELREERRELGARITVSRQNLERLYTQLERQQQPQGKIFCKIPIYGCLFNICCCLSI